MLAAVICINLSRGSCDLQACIKGSLKRNIDSAGFISAETGSLIETGTEYFVVSFGEEMRCSHQCSDCDSEIA